MSNLVIRGLKEETDLLKLLADLCVNLQKEYDIHPETLSQLINNPSFLRYCSLLYYQCYGEMITNLNQFKSQYNNGSLEEVIISSKRIQKMRTFDQNPPQWLYYLLQCP